MPSVPFDRAASYYDRTRGMGEDALAAITGLLAEELRGRGLILEAGIGTGMLALPLAAAGVSIAGVDLSRPMLERLLRNAGDAPATRPPALAQADATALPFRERAFGGVLLRHVLHLVPAWRDALAEAVRVTGPGGVILVGHGDWPDLYRTVLDRFVAEAGVEPWVGPRRGVGGPGARAGRGPGETRFQLRMIAFDL